MVNLTTPKHQAQLIRLYYIRIGTVLCVTLALAGTAVAALLLPSYFLIHAEADQAAEYVETARAIATERSKSQSQETLAAFNDSIKLLTNAQRSPVFAHVLEVLTETIPKGVALTNIDATYADAQSVRVVVRGVARTRAELIAYSNTLKRHPELSGVVVPVSDLVADVDGAFSVTLTWNRPKKS
jgi:Tfp pilus assembly protein PilN